MRQKPLDLGRQIRGVSGREQQAGAPVLDDLRHRSQPRRNDRQPAAEGFEDDHRKPLIAQGREDQKGGLPHEPEHFGSWPVAEQFDSGHAPEDRLVRPAAHSLQRRAAVQTLPRPGQHTQALFLHMPAGEHSVAAGFGAGARVRPHEIRLDHDLPGRQPARDESRTGERGERDVQVHGVGPDACGPVDGAHARDGCRRGPAPAVASVKNPRPGHRTAEAGLARAAAPLEQRIWAEQAVVMKRLDDGRAPRTRRAVASRREQREGIVEVHHLGPAPLDQGPEFAAGLPVPHRFGRYLDPAHPERAAIIGRVPQHRVAAVFEQPGFGGEHLVLPARFQVVVVGCQNTHFTRCLRCRRVIGVAAGARLSPCAHRARRCDPRLLPYVARRRPRS